jgi:hypothetical protein
VFPHLFIFEFANGTSKPVRPVDIFSLSCAQDTVGIRWHQLVLESLSRIIRIARVLPYNNFWIRFSPKSVTMLQRKQGGGRMATGRQGVGWRQQQGRRQVDRTITMLHIGNLTWKNRTVSGKTKFFSLGWESFSWQG